MVNKGNSLWKEAKKIIPGGNTLISKRQEKFIREKWPTYYSKAKKCEIWDLSGKKFYDLSLMGVGTNILGYANSEVDNAVIKAIKKSNMSTLNCPEEVQLAKKLLKMHPWAGVVKFTRSGGEANALAIRMARAHTKKNNIAFCGYHGWHDWYLSANLSDKKNLGKFLSNNINISGVSKNLKNTSFPFKYNEFEALNKVIKKKNIGIIKMEVERNEKPKKNFLKKIRNISNKKKIILIFDECTSGFRATFGGIHKKHKVNPDMMILGKALGNGYAINAVLAKKDFLKSSESLFISSTFWGERAGYVAALKTLEIMKKKKSWKIISKIGKQIKKKWILLAKKNKLDISIFGLDALCGFTIKSKNFLKYKNYITQEMLKNGFLASNIIYVCVEHNSKILKRYFTLLDKLFYKISFFENKKENIDNYLKNLLIEKSFRE